MDVNAHCVLCGGQTESREEITFSSVALLVFLYGSPLDRSSKSIGRLRESMGLLKEIANLQEN